MMNLFATPVFEATVIFEEKELFKGRGAASVWAERLSKELETPVRVDKIGTGWALFATLDGEDGIWAIHGQRIKRIA